MVTRILIWLCLLATAPVNNIRAQGQTYAVVVGVSDYKFLSDNTGDLHFADRDARQVAAFLESKIGGSVPNSHILLLTNSQATRTRIGQAVSLFRRAKAGDRVLFYFSGHGLADSFAPYDALPGRAGSMLTHTDIKEAFRQSSASTKLCIADACLSGSMTQVRVPHPSPSPTIADAGKGNVAMLLASRSTQVAVESRRLTGGAFTHYLLLGLGGRADQNADRTVTIRELHQYIAPRVRQATEGRQTPVFYGRFSDNLALTYL
ncbi:caspase family protein [Spirosoma rigui]|uniref:caspase family protein n=1 Tax=Spirosoma rigui TaxID=564064 RepID=UPI0009B0D489|nr:caspase family protein [Spirosoma rigui]